MIHLEFDTQHTREVHAHKNYEVIFVMDGSCAVILDDTRRRLSSGEFVIANSGQKHGYSLGGGKNLIGRFHIPYSHIADEYDDKIIMFYLSAENGKKADALNKAGAILSQMFAASYKSEYGDELGIPRLYYGFLEILFEHFACIEKEKSAPAMDAEADRRICEIMEYVNHHYNKNISLNDLASRLYLSSAYLSKYIKQQLGVNFVELLNKTRLSHAAERLTHTDETIAQVALDVGFSNLASFNRNFKEKYGMTPSAYRRALRPTEGVPAMAMEPLAALDHPESTGALKDDPRYADTMLYEEIFVENGGASGVLTSRPWNRTINIGAAQELLHSDVQAHVLELKNRLHFRYVRFWDIYSPGMYLDVHEPGQVYNFSRLDRVLDFLVDNHLVPHMEVGNKPKKLMRAMRDDMLVPKKGDSPFKSPEMIRYFFSALMRHLIRRYGAEVLDKWVFEYWMEEDEDRACDQWHSYNEEMVREYLEHFSVLAQTVRWFGTNLKVGGGGFSLRYGREWFEYIIREWAGREQTPSFVSLYIYPYALREDDICLNNRVLRPDYVRSCLEFARAVLEREKLSVRLVVTEWNFTVFNRNLMNDSVHKGAWMVKNLMDCMGLAEIMAYWTGSDLYAECNDQTDFISGNVGLMTRDGIKKPVWYAIEFMNSLERFICKKTDNVIVTRGKYKNFKIVCHNFKAPNYRYYLKPEDEITLEDMAQFFDDRRFLRVYFELPVLPDDTYRIKFLRVSQSHGSVLDAWAAMCRPEYMDGADIDYLKKQCVPQITVRTYKEKNGKIAFTTMLEPDEIQLILVECQGRF